MIYVFVLRFWLQGADGSGIGNRAAIAMHGWLFWVEISYLDALLCCCCFVLRVADAAGGRVVSSFLVVTWWLRLRLWLARAGMRRFEATLNKQLRLQLSSQSRC